MATTLRIPGKKLTQKDLESKIFKSPLMEKLKEHVETYNIEGSERAMSEAHVTSINKDDIFYYTFEDGSGLFLAYDEILSLNERENLANPNRGSQYTGELLLPIQYSTGISRNGTKKNGIITQASILRGNNINNLLLNNIGQYGASYIAKKLETKLVETEGVFVVNPDRTISKNKPIKAENGKQYFLLIHGTNSNTTNAFNDYNASKSGEENIFKSIQELYKDQVLAFEHHTLTKSVFKNIITLVADLPVDIELNILSHSRGGLVIDGLLLCIELVNNPTLKSEIIENLKLENRGKDADAIDEICKTLLVKNIKIHQVIKVASPGGGTSLLSDNSINIIRVLAEISKWSTGYIYDEAIELLEELIIAFIKTKDNPEILPGLEVMNPDSPFLHLINTVSYTEEINTFILAGKSGLNWNVFHSIKYILSRLVIQDDSDMVVNTESMTQGIPFKEYAYYLAKGSEVHHSSYFYKKDTIDLINSAITKKGNFLPNEQISIVQRETKQRGIIGLEYGSYLHQEISGKKPITVLIPGMMASTLSENGDLLWIDYTDFLKRRLLDMTIDKSFDIDGVLSTPYEKFCKYLIRNGHDVYTIPYDWRQSYDSQMDDVKKHIEIILNTRNNQPIRVLTHSKGGLIFRHFCSRHYDLYKQLSESKDFRWIMFGTPWYGSYATVKTLIGQSKTLKNLRMCSVFVAYKKLLEVFSKYPGVIELLPMNINTGISNYDFSDRSVWEYLYHKDKDGNYKWVLPKDSDLKNFKDLVDLTRSIKFVDDFDKVSTIIQLKKSQIFYIAGNDDKTDFNLKEGKDEICCDHIENGDGTVTWLEGIPQEFKPENIFYVDTKHQRLLDDSSTFENILKLISTGYTNLSKNPLKGKVRSGKKGTIPPVYDGNKINSNIIRNNLNQIFDQDFVTKTHDFDLINVSISHGDLTFGTGPIIVGHFSGEYITKAERVLDIALDYALTRRFTNKVYPGAVGTSLFILRAQYKKPIGTLVVGLGNQFDLTGFTLSNTIKDGIINAYFQHKEAFCLTEVPFPDTWTSLLIGTAFGNLTIATSIKSIITGVEMANKQIQEHDNSNEVFGNTIKNVEFIEIYNDKAYSVYYALAQFHKDGFLNLVDKKIRIKPGAMNNLSIDYGIEGWNRLTIRGLKKCPLQLSECSKNTTSLTFDLNIGIAKEESKEVFINKDLIDKLLFELVRENETLKYWDKKISKTLFERLIPQDFKTNIRMQYNLVMNLDIASAIYPWELIQDTSLTEKPLCVTAGLIRQLNTPNCGQAKTYAEGNSILVIGDPILDSQVFSQLSGAEIEAKNVVALFENQAYEVESVISKRDYEIFQELYSKPHRIIHVAAHGDFDYSNPFKSGIVIGTKKISPKAKSSSSDINEEPVFLTAYDIVQLDPMPEFVFINTCYSGKGFVDESEFNYKTYEFAANIGEQFIREGVKAIIVAGWPVYDDLALLFAQTFYSQMFDGANFGLAIQKAREACFLQDPDKNTWGAYQCYGDPMFKFDMTPPYHTSKLNVEREVLYELENINSQAELSPVRGKYLKDKLEIADNAIIELKIKDAVILEKQAMAHYKLGNNKKAKEIFSNLFILENATFSLRSLEQIYLIQAKIDVEESTAKDYIDKIKNLQNIVKKFEYFSKNIGVTAERYTLIGAIYKRIAYLNKKFGGSTGLLDLQKSILNYTNGWNEIKAKLQDDEFSFYHPLVILQLNAVMGKTNKVLYDEVSEKLKSYILKQDYFEQTIKFNLFITEYLMFNTSSFNPDISKTVSKFLCEKFDEVWNNYGAFHHLKGEYEHQENIIEFLEVSDPRRIELQHIINHIRKIENDKNK